MSGRHNGCPALMTIAAAPFCAMAGFPAFSNLPLPMSGLLSDPWFYAAAIPAVILVGLSKGGFGGAVGFVGVPLMALTIPPVQAAAILLPILCLMDVVSVWTWWGIYDRKMLVDMMPGAVAVPHGWGHQGATGLGVASKTGGANVNLLAADGPASVDRISGMAQLTGILVDVKRATPPTA